MTFKEYEAHAASIACYAKEVAILYVVMGLTNELAEVFEKVDNAAEAKEIMKEIGDVLWYVAMTRQELQLPPVEFPEELHKLDDTDVYKLSPSYLLQQVGIINGQVKKYFRDDDYNKPFPEKRKELCHTALEQILVGLQNLVTYIERKESNQSLVSIAKQNVEKLAKRKAENKFTVTEIIGNGRAITFLGASCVGKTSVFELLKKDRSFDRFDKIDSITRQLVREGKIEPSFTSVQNQKLIFDKYAELLNTDCYVSDRSIIDVHTFTKTIPASIQKDAELRRQLDFLNVSEYFLPIIFYFPIYWDVENDGERMADAERRKCWDAEIRKFLIERKLPYEVIPNDTPFNRLKFIKSVLNTRINLG